MTYKLSILCATALLTTGILSSCSKKEDVQHPIELEAGQRPAGDPMGMWEAITKNMCTDRAKEVYTDGKQFELISFDIHPNPPRKSEDGKYEYYDKVTCNVNVSF